MQGRAYIAYVDSDYRASGTSSSFQYRIDLPEYRKFDRVTLLQGSFPKSFYLVRDGYNTFTLHEGAGSAVITVPAGNYSMVSFRVVLQQLMTSNSPGGRTYTITQPVTTTSASTGKYTYTVSAGADQPRIVFPEHSKLFSQMGFDYASDNQFVADSLVSTNAVNFNTTTGLVVKSNLVRSEGSHPNLKSGTLQEVYAFNTFDFANIGFQNQNAELSSKELLTSQVSVAEFTITDLDDDPIDFNGQSCNFSLAFYKADDSPELISKDIRMRWFNDLLDKKE
jgi:hypothetical protein